MLLLCTGCSMEKEKNQPMNPVLLDPAFQQAFTNRKILLIAPASGIEPEKIQAIRTQTQLDIEVPNDIMVKAVPYHAQTDEQRFKFLKKALFTQSKKTILWTLRGGYGTARLIDKLENLPIPKQQKIFIGSSDITALHLFLSQRWGWHTIHGSGLSELTNVQKDPQNLLRIADIVAKRSTQAQINDLMPYNALAESTPKITGRLTGGNLSIIQTSLGTRWQIKTAGKIIFIEDVKEKGYKIDRALNHLRQAGIFAKAKAIVFGDFFDPADEHVDFALKRFASEVNIPVFKTNQFGHGKMNYPLIYNSKSEIVDSTLKMKIES